MECITFGDGCANPPHGVLGGTPGIGGGQYIENRRSGTRSYVTASGHVRIAREEIYVGVSTGGGGYGDPLRRESERVRQDVRDGIITRDAAKRVFGVVVTEEFDPALVEKETAERRHLNSGRQVSLVTPTEPAAGPESAWVESDRRDGDAYLINPVS